MSLENPNYGNIGSDGPEMMPLTPETMDFGGAINLLAGIVEAAKNDYISTAKDEYARSGKWDRETFDVGYLTYSERQNWISALNFVKKDPYNAFQNFSPDEIFDAWDKLMKNDIHARDQVMVVSENTRLPYGTICKVERVYNDEYYIRNIDSKYCCWAKIEDIMLFYDATHCRKFEEAKTKTGKNRTASHIGS